jgi:SNF2 family DNA or RNA helicase
LIPRLFGIQLTTTLELTQTQSQSQKNTADPIDLISEDDDMPVTTRSKFSRSRGASPGTDDVTAEDDDNVASDWSEEDTRAFYQEWKDRKKNKRKRVAAETNRIRADKKSKVAAAAASSIIGRKPPAKRTQRNGHTGFSTDSVGDDAGAKDTFLDDPIPDYIMSRQRSLKKLHEAGLRYPPSYKGIDFAVSEKEEKPVLDKVIKPQREKKDIKLRESGGTIPGPIAQWLRDYQVEGVQFLHERFVKQTGTILGDDMGLGKTIQVIGFLTAAFGKTATKSDAKCMRQIRRYGEGRWYPRVLIVCPGTLMSNWEDELAKWGWWEVSRYHGSNAADRKGVLAAAANGRLEIVITTYTTYRGHESGKS